MPLEFTCPIQRLAPPRTCAQIMVVMLSMAWAHILNFFLLTASSHSHLWPFNTPSQPLPLLLSVSLWASSSLCNSKPKYFSGFCPEIPCLPDVLNAPGSSHPPHGFNSHLCTEDAHTCISGPDISWTSKLYIQLPVRHLYVELSEEVQNQHVKDSSILDSNSLSLL